MPFLGRFFLNNFHKHWKYSPLYEVDEKTAGKMSNKLSWLAKGCMMVLGDQPTLKKDRKKAINLMLITTFLLI